MINPEPSEYIDQETKDLNLDTVLKSFIDLDGRVHKTLFVGNSGLQFNLFPTNPLRCHMHFMPENYLGSAVIDELKRDKYSVVFGAAFYKFYLWWSNPANFRDIERPRLVVGSTNKRMSNFRAKLFNRNDEIYRSEEVTPGDYNYSIDLEKVGQNPNLIERLRRFYQRSQTEKYKMDQYYRKIKLSDFHSG